MFVCVTTRTPYRICLTGGNDLLPYVKKFGGESFGVTIDKYATVTLRRRSDDVVHASYPDGEEHVTNINDIKNGIIREALRLHGIQDGIDIESRSDIPPGSGLGSSGAFAVGLLHAIHILKGEEVSSRALAEEAARLEIEILRSPIGKHDQYMAAYGGFLHLLFHSDGSVGVEHTSIPANVRNDLEHNLVLVFSGQKRSATKVLESTALRFEESASIFDEINSFRKAGNVLRGHLMNGQTDDFAKGLKQLLEAKKKCYRACTNDRMDSLVERGYALGAIGAKIIGAGGGGFAYFYVPSRSRKTFERGIVKYGGTPTPFRLEDHGTRVVDKS